MENIQYYMDFAAGNLDNQAEQNFTRLLSDDIEFRNGFKSYLTITTAINKNINKFLPANHITERIFEKTGTIKTNNFKNTNSFTKLKSHLVTIVLTAILSSLVTFFAVDHFSNIRDNNLGNQQFVTNDKNIVKDNENWNKPVKSEIKKIAPDQKINSFNSADSSFLSADNLLSTENLEHEIIIDDKPELNDAPIDFSEYFPFLESNIKNINLINDEIKYSYDSVLSNSYNKSNLCIEVQNSINWNIPKETIEPVYISKFNNVGVAFSYNFTENISLGLDLRQETFFVQYRGFEGSNEYKYEHQPNLLSYNGLLKYKFNEILGVKPLLQFNAGFNKAGIIIRQSLGLEYCLVPKILLFINGEYSYYMFSHQSKVFNSSKFNINYGIGFQL